MLARVSHTPSEIYQRGCVVWIDAKEHTSVRDKCESCLSRNGTQPISI
jgi:hypothetical protein